jgi:hypothetical protein
LKKRQGTLKEATKTLIEALDDTIYDKEKELTSLKAEKLLLEKKLLEEA